MTSATSMGGTDSDARWMRAALVEARKGEGLTRPNPPVGSVIVRNGRIVGRGYHQKAGGPHAEIHALRDAGSSARGGSLYVTLEPCCTHGRTPPCTDAILASGVKTVVYAVTDPNPSHAGRAMRILQKRGIIVRTGVCEEEGREILAPFHRWITTRTPWLTLKLAMSLDGRIADATGSSKWITSPPARELVQSLRRRVDAIMVGATTAVLDNPGLLVNEGDRKPYRVIVDSTGRLSPRARVVSDASATQTLIATTHRCTASRMKSYERHGARVIRCRSEKGRVDLSDLLRRLGEKGILHVLCEGGGELSAALLHGGHIDRLLMFYAPIIMGGTAKPGIAGKGWPLAKVPRFAITSVSRLGPDVAVQATVLK